MGKWIVGWNNPGYLPDNPPYEFETFDAAQDFLIQELTEQAVSCSPDVAEKWNSIIDDVAGVNLPGEDFAVFAPDDLVYFVNEVEDD